MHPRDAVKLGAQSLDAPHIAVEDDRQFVALVAREELDEPPALADANLRPLVQVVDVDVARRWRVRRLAPEPEPDVEGVDAELFGVVAHLDADPAEETVMARH